jgi:hypothetical protein
MHYSAHAAENVPCIWLNLDRVEKIFSIAVLYKLRCMLYRILPPSGLLRGVRWFETDVSGLPVGPIFNGQPRMINILFPKTD